MGNPRRPKKKKLIDDEKRISILFFASKIGLSRQEFQKISSKETSDEEVREILNNHNKECWELICDCFNKL